ncbi:hypothetical protein ACWKWU_15255 [Chitinophaga lutea]
MAKQTGFFKFTGKLGDAIGYCVDGQYYLRSMPSEVRQSPRTRQSSKRFGQASRLGAVIRHALDGQLTSPSCDDYGNRLNKALLSILKADDSGARRRFVPRHFRQLENFKLNRFARPVPHPQLDQDAEGNVRLTIPAGSYWTFNPSASHISVRAIALELRPGFKSAQAVSSRQVMLPCDEPIPEIVLTLPACKGAVTCVILEVNACSETEGRFYPLRNRLFNTAEVIAVLTGRRRCPAFRRRTYGSRSWNRFARVPKSSVSAHSLPDRRSSIAFLCPLVSF